MDTPRYTIAPPAGLAEKLPPFRRPGTLYGTLEQLRVMLIDFAYNHGIDLYELYADQLWEVRRWELDPGESYDVRELTETLLVGMAAQVYGCSPERVQFHFALEEKRA